MSSEASSSSSSKKGVKRALLIGLRYDQLKMVYTYQDCDTVKEFLMNEEFPEENIKMLKDIRESSPENTVKLTNMRIEYEIRNFIDEAKRRDVSVLYVSGHGGKPDSPAGPGLLASVDYKPVNVTRITKSLTKLPDDTKFLILIDACHGANFRNTFNEKLVMFISSQDTEGTSASNLHGSHFTNTFLHTVERHREKTLPDAFEIIKTKLRSSGINQTPSGLCSIDKRDLIISQLFDHDNDDNDQ